MSLLNNVAREYLGENVLVKILSLLFRSWPIKKKGCLEKQLDFYSEAEDARFTSRRLLSIPKCLEFQALLISMRPGCVPTFTCRLG